MAGKYEKLLEENKELKDKNTKMITDSFHEKIGDKIKEQLIPKSKIEDKIKAIVFMIQDDVVVLSVKRLEDDPWKSINESFKIGDQVKGIVTRVLDYGAFVEIKPNLLGLLHKTNINTTTKDIRTIVSKGQEIGVNIISIDKENRKISFAMINV